MATIAASNLAKSPTVQKYASKLAKSPTVQKYASKLAPKSVSQQPQPNSLKSPPIINQKQTKQLSVTDQKGENININLSSPSTPVNYASSEPVNQTQKQEVVKTDTGKIVGYVFTLLILVGFVCIFIFLDCNDVGSYRSTGESATCGSGNLCDGCDSGS